MAEKTVHIFLEIDEDTLDEKMYATLKDAPFSDMLKNFEFNSTKDLVHFLNKNKDYIINSIPSSESELLYYIEMQGFLEYLETKWYQVTPEHKYEKIISPTEILDLGLKYEGISEKDVMNYILEYKPGFLYEYRKCKLWIP